MYSMNKKVKELVKINKKETSKEKNKSCDNFCKYDYSPEIEKQLKKIAKVSKLTYKPNKETRNFRISACKQIFCNEGCKGYKFLSKKEENDFKKKINGSFLKKIKPETIQKIKLKGAISYCDNNGYNPFHN